MKAILFADGAARGNPGPAGLGAVILDDKGAILAEIAEAIGTATNNVAEYRALLAGLRRARELGVTSIDIRLDSELIVRQLEGQYRVKHPGLVPLFREAQKALGRFSEYTVRHVRREENRHADRLANQALDARL